MRGRRHSLVGAGREAPHPQPQCPAGCRVVAARCRWGLQHRERAPAMAAVRQHGGAGRQGRALHQPACSPGLLTLEAGGGVSWGHSVDGGIPPSLTMSPQAWPAKWTHCMHMRRPGVSTYRCSLARGRTLAAPLPCPCHWRPPRRPGAPLQQLLRRQQKAPPCRAPERCPGSACRAGQVSGHGRPLLSGNHITDGKTRWEQRTWEPCKVGGIRVRTAGSGLSQSTGPNLPRSSSHIFLDPHTHLSLASSSGMAR